LLSCSLPFFRAMSSPFRLNLRSRPKV
jgi:hypothetical protein